MTNYNSCLTPADSKSKPSLSDGTLLENPMEYRSLAGALQYLTLTRPDICYVVQQVCSFMHAPTIVHMNLVKKILRYVKGTISHGLHLNRSPSSDLVIYSDADWAGWPDIDALPQVYVPILDPILFRGRERGKAWFPGPTLKRSIAVLPM
jgi:hypothetical protein